MTYRGRRSYAPRPARWMDLKYAGACHVCGASLGRGARGFYDPETRAVTCTDMDCCEKDGLTAQEWWGAPTSGQWVTKRSDHRIGAGVPVEPRIVVTRFSSGATSYRNSRGRCEDAPCCGCCS